MIHRAILGSFERFIGILLEHLSGNLPVWLAPIQCRVISFTDRNEKACRRVIKQIAEAIPNIRIDADFTSTTVSEKVRNSELMKIPYLITIGDKEEKAGTIAVKKRGEKEKPKFNINLENFIFELKKEIEERN